MSEEEVYKQKTQTIREALIKLWAKEYTWEEFIDSLPVTTTVGDLSNATRDLNKEIKNHVESAER